MSDMIFVLQACYCIEVFTFLLLFSRDLCQRLLLVHQCKSMGEIPGRGFEQHEVFKLQNVAMIPVSTDAVALDGVNLKPCPKHHASFGQVFILLPVTYGLRLIDFFKFIDGSTTTSVPVEPQSSTGSDASPPPPANRMPFPLRATADAVKASAGSAAAALASQVKRAGKNVSPSPTVLTSGPGITREMERFERRMLDEFSRMLNDSDSFYFSLTGGLTNTMQRQNEGMERGETAGAAPAETPMWKRADDRFFFNKHLLQELIDLDDDGADPFILPIIQGYVELRKAQLRLPGDQEGAASGLPEYYTVALISRRCRHRAGTRYNRRGVDESGWVANEVETEQVLLYHHYALSFVMTRGSVPVFWSQPGYKYRPPPRLDRTEQEDVDAFRKHIRRMMEIYGKPVSFLFRVESMPIGDDLIWFCFS